MRVSHLSMFALVVVLVCLATVEADPIKIEIDATGHVGGASALNPAAGGNVNKLGDEDEDEDDFFDAAELARRAEMLKENQIKASAGPPRPTAPIPKSQDSYDWRNTELTSHMWRIIHEGNVEEVQRTILDQPECVHVRSEDGRGALWWAYEYNKPEIVKLLIHWGASETDRDAGGKVPKEMA